MDTVHKLKHEADTPSGRHTVGNIVRDGWGGKVYLRLECIRPHCDCVSFHSLEDLLKIMQELQDGQKGKEAA